MGLSPKEMEEAIIRNLSEKTGKTLAEWHELLSHTEQSTKKEMKSLLKSGYQLGHFQAQVIVNRFFENRS